MHGFACKNLHFPHPAAPALARPESLHAPALKAPREAGRRGGESIARLKCRIHLVIQIKFW
ncbi:hypothetical protein L1P07_03970 [Edwardsiella piscicida]|uniref:Uncharacterized protein n=1 Tax=Edwardsiella piscicida TaxID=1263550 RepID=A0AAQ3C5R9_EDWPI|nr:hypothetical protein [Edwardsiella piscicida]MDM3865222.1 hypothetical protein [Edwardsiella piscicida]UJT84134.1 hypothetical protein L1P07_03970 [Edwardsiella piscicida]UJT87404.1 hypothetical protein L1P05_03970 [Edwardsiella piscicida]WDU92683.1 hypothetical protein PWJ79_03970 [Edwardsiella piscicida]WLJ45040.1 hypothetical protein Q8004_04040 [Edwardsiella piscicida]